jgi:acetyl-CoA carboxylase carboxyl transferase subunit alpha
METAAKFGLPIVCLIDTAGAYPGIGAEERGQAYQIAYNLREMSRIATPIVCVIIGEGGSGGALGIGIGDHVAILEFVISPEGCAGILWKHQKFADRAAQSLRFTARDLHEFGIVDEIIKEPLGGAHRDHRGMATRLKGSLVTALRRLGAIPRDQLLQQRYDKFRRFGVFEEHAAGEAERDTAH